MKTAAGACAPVFLYGHSVSRQCRDDAAPPRGGSRHAAISFRRIRQRRLPSCVRPRGSGGARFRARRYRALFRCGTGRDIFHIRRHGVGQLGAQRRGAGTRQRARRHLRRRASRGVRERKTTRKAWFRTHRTSRGRGGFRVRGRPRRRHGRGRVPGQRDEREQRNGQHTARARTCRDRARLRRAVPYRRCADGRCAPHLGQGDRRGYAFSLRAQVRGPERLRRAVCEERGKTRTFAFRRRAGERTQGRHFGRRLRTSREPQALPPR